MGQQVWNRRFGLQFQNRTEYTRSRNNGPERERERVGARCLPVGLEKDKETLARQQCCQGEIRKTRTESTPIRSGSVPLADLTLREFQFSHPGSKLTETPLPQLNSRCDFRGACCLFTHQAYTFIASIQRTYVQVK